MPLGHCLPITGRPITNRANNFSIRVDVCSLPQDLDRCKAHRHPAAPRLDCEPALEVAQMRANFPKRLRVGQPPMSTRIVSAKRERQRQQLAAAGSRPRYVHRRHLLGVSRRWGVRALSGAPRPSEMSRRLRQGMPTRSFYQRYSARPSRSARAGFCDEKLQKVVN